MLDKYPTNGPSNSVIMLQSARNGSAQYKYLNMSVVLWREITDEMWDILQKPKGCVYVV